MDRDCRLASLPVRESGIARLTSNDPVWVEGEDSACGVGVERQRQRPAADELAGRRLPTASDERPLSRLHALIVVLAKHLAPAAVRLGNHFLT